MSSLSKKKNETEKQAEFPRRRARQRRPTNSVRTPKKRNTKSKRNTNRWVRAFARETKARAHARRRREPKSKETHLESIVRGAEVEWTRAGTRPQDHGHERIETVEKKGGGKSSRKLVLTNPTWVRPLRNNTKGTYVPIKVETKRTKTC